MADINKRMLYRDWLNLRLHLLWCYDHAVLHNREHREVHREHDYVNNGVWLVRSGWAEIKYEDVVTRAESGQWLIVKPGRRIQSFAPGTILLSIAFEATWPDGTNWLESGLPLVIDAKDHPALERSAKPMVKIMTELTDAQWDAREYPADYRQFLLIERCLKNYFLILMDILVTHNVHPKDRTDIDQRVIHAVYQIDDQSLGEPLDVDALARQVGLSAVHLTRLFYQDIGSTPRGYFVKRRLNYAYHQLRMPDTRIKEVAFALGFIHLSHFSKWFKQLSGQSPKEYIKTA